MQELRRRLRRLRKSLSKPVRHKKGRKLLYQCQKAGLFRTAKHIAIFTPNDGEVETKNIIKFLVNQGHYIYFPILVGEKLKFAKVGQHFLKNRFGIDEPIFTPLLGAHEMNLILMPLVGFDKYKNRMGMGGGFYDKTLEFKTKQDRFNKPKLFALAFDCQEVNKLDAKPWDVPVDGIITPTRIIR
jgi:5-formyltetrahydrofolate cyclo-ligase